MDTPISDIMIHVDESLTADEIAGVTEEVRGDSCVVSACVSPSDGHLIMVTYNPDCTSSSNILGAVTRRGLHAELVGF